MLAGSIMSAYGQKQAGDAALMAGEFNANNLERNAVLARQQAAEEERRLRVMARKSIGEMRANFGASGVTMEGSALDVLQESAAMAELDALTIRHRGDAQAAQMRNEAISERYRGASAQAGSRWSAAGTLLSGGAQAYSMKRT